MKPVSILAIFLLGFTYSRSLAQTVDFTADVTSGCPPSLQVNFTDLSAGNPSSWSWNFGNGNTSTLQNPSAIYTSPGTYTVTLTVNGSNTKTKTNYITVYQKPAVDFGVDNTSGCAPLSVQFTNSSTAGSGSITSYSWVFGDGGTSSGSAPSHIYSTAANYSVALTVKNEHNCSNVLVKNALINVKGPTVNFSADKTNFCLAPATVQFTNSSSGVTPFIYEWNFGDGSVISTDANPSHQYTSTGIFNVSLTVTDANGCKISKNRTSYIAIGSDPGVNFNVSATKVCIGDVVSLQKLITVPVNSFLWNLGNGSETSEPNPTVIYTQAGVFRVTLSASLPSGCTARVSKDIEVVANAVPNFATVQKCDRKVTFTNLSTSYASVQWKFGYGPTSTETSPTHTFPIATTYTVTLTTYNSLNCPTSIEKVINVIDNPEAVIYPNLANSCTEPSLAGCAPFGIQFKNNSKSFLPINSTLWNFGDNTSSSANNPLHTYNVAETYNVSLTVTNTLNCKSTATAVVKVSSTTPKADFSINKTTACAREKINFTNLSLNANFWCWDFGDNTTSNERDPVHYYDKPGVYTVTLIAKNEGCQNILVKQNLITIKAPYLGFEVQKNCASPYDITLINNSTNYDNILISFGDGTTNTSGGNLQHHYVAPGNYKINLTISSFATSCNVTDSIAVLIQEVKSDFNVATNPVCKNSPLLFKDKSQAAVKWEWSFGDGKISSLQDGINSYKDPGDYNASLKVTDSDGCSSTKGVSIKVADMAAAYDFTASSDCNQLEVNFNDRSTANPPVTSWLWEFGDGQSSTDRNPVHTYTEQKSFPLKFTITNDDALCSIYVEDAIFFTTPKVDFSAEKAFACLDEQILFTNKSQFASIFSWDFGNGVTSSLYAPTAEYSLPGNYTVTLIAKDLYGCEKSIIKDEYIEITKPVAAFEAFQTSAECPPLITTFKDKSIGAIKWNWNFGDGQTSEFQNPVITYLVPGIYDVVLEVSDKAGCSTSVRAEKLVSLGGPYGTFSISPIVCINGDIDFIAAATNTSKYTWDFGDGNVVSTDLDRITHKYSKEGIINLSLVLEDNKGCKVEIGKGRKIVVTPRPEIDFDYEPEFPFEGEPVIFTAKTNAEVDFSWEFGTEKIQDDGIVERPFSIYGSHKVTLTVKDDDGCDNLVSKDILVQGEIKMIPNVFTPNSDEFNEKLIIENVENGFWELKVFNRWGQLCYKEDEYRNQWDGFGLSTGVYYYQLKNKYRSSKYYKGYVQILR